MKRGPGSKKADAMKRSARARDRNMGETIAANKRVYSLVGHFNETKATLECSIESPAVSDEWAWNAQEGVHDSSRGVNKARKLV